MKKTSKYQKEIDLALQLAKEGIRISQWFQNENFDVIQKGDDTPVTYADLAVQTYIISRIKENFPHDKIIAEEDDVYMNDDTKVIISECFSELGIDVVNVRELLNYRGKPAERKWTIDPIDGTQGFIEGLVYAVGIGLMEGNVPKMCAIGVPNYKDDQTGLFYTEEGQGSMAAIGNGPFHKIEVSDRSQLDEITFCQSLHYDKPWVSEFADNVHIPNRIKMDSMAKFCMIADGKADLYIKPVDPDHSFSWDYLPGDLLIREAGGMVTDNNNLSIKFDNKLCKWSEPAIIASNGVIHEEVLKILKEMAVF